MFQSIKTRHAKTQPSNESCTQVTFTFISTNSVCVSKCVTADHTLVVVQKKKNVFKRCLGTQEKQHCKDDDSKRSTIMGFMFLSDLL